MENFKTDDDNPASRKGHVEELTPRPDPFGEGYASKVLMNVGRQRFELTVRVELREIKRGPAEVIQMPGSSPTEA